MSPNPSSSGLPVEFNQALFETLSVGILYQNGEGSVLAANPAALKLFGNDLEAFKARAASGPGWQALRADGTLFPKDEYPNTLALRTRKAVLNVLMRLQHPQSGAQTWVSVSAYPQAKTPADKPDFVITTLEDVSEKVRSEEKYQRQLERLRALQTIDKAVTSSLNVHLTLNTLVEQTVAHLKVDAACVLLFNEPMQALEYAAGCGFKAPESLRKISVRVGEGDAGQAALDRRPIQTPTNFDPSSAPARAALLQTEAFQAYYAMPLVLKGFLKGVLEIYHRASLAPDAEWMDFVQTLAGQAALAVENAQLFEGLQRSNTELALAYDATIEGWARAMDLRDRETEGHTQRVADQTVKLVRAAGLNNEQIANARRGALLHDIGKLGVPDSILLNPGRLTPEEWVVMRKHPQHAYDMLSSIDYLRPALAIPYCHHEKWDGTGYPRGIKGEQIPLVARLFAIVDVWNALRFDRPYRAGWDNDKVLTYIRSLSGSHFDPGAVAIFFQTLEDHT